jgi:hypothetical protein
LFPANYLVLCAIDPTGRDSLLEHLLFSDNATSGENERVLGQIIKLGIYAICLSLLAPSSAFAYFDRGNMIYETCSSSGISKQLACLAAASAYYDMMQVLGYFCPNTDGLNKEQVVDVLTKFLKENPELRNRSAASLAIQAFTRGFGCKKR